MKHIKPCFCPRCAWPCLAAWFQLVSAARVDAVGGYPEASEGASPDGYPSAWLRKVYISYPLSSLVIPCPIMNSGSEVLMQTVNYTNRLITHVYECLWCVSAGIQLRLDTWLIRCDSLISCVIAWAWFQPLHRLVPVLSSFGRATSVDVVNLLDSRCTATSRAGFNGWRRGMAWYGVSRQTGGRTFDGLFE